MATDLTQLFYQLLDGPEFISFHNRVGGVVNSSKLQIKRCVIQLQDTDSHRWLFFSNGYVREQLGPGWVAKVLSKPPEGWDKENVTYDMMAGQFDKAHTRIDKREGLINKRIMKISKKPELVFGMLFDPDDYVYIDHPSWIFNRPRLEDWSNIIEGIHSYIYPKPSIMKK